MSPPAPLTLSKSDFKVARECATKLYYRKRRFPNTMQDDAYLQLLAEGGYAVGKLAQLLHPGGVDLGDIGDPEIAVQQTNALLAAGDATIFEAGVRHGDLLVRVDVLVKQGSRVDLIEVKSKSYDSTAPDIAKSKGGIRSEWVPYLEDVAFQTLVVRRAFPELEVVPYLLLPDKSRRTAIDGLNSQFRIEMVPPAGGSSFRQFRVAFTGDPDALCADRLLAKVAVAALVDPLVPELEAEAARLTASLNPSLQRLEPRLSTACARCEYRGATDDPAVDGFRHCWGARAEVTPSVLDLYHAGNFKQALDPMIANGGTALHEIPDSVFGGHVLRYHGRPWMQKHVTDERVSQQLQQTVREWRYPLHFIDFETSRMALPYHRGMRPYEQIAFQWSCHTVREEGAAPEHREWINTEDAFPSFDFARALMETLGTEGTVLMWALHEAITLRDIRRQMEEFGHADEALAAWLEFMVPPGGSTSDSRLIDMDALARAGYFHPSTQARTSIKCTLPAVLQAPASPRIAQWLATFAPGLSLQGWGPEGLVNPYSLLPGVESIDEYARSGGADGYQVNEGTGAMRAYQDMLYGLARDDAATQQRLRKALRHYCQLDTLAMVIIWEHWRTAPVTDWPV